MKYVVAAVSVVVLFLVVVFGFGYVGFSNDANRYEVAIKAKYDDNRNIYDNGWKKVKEISQVPDMYQDDLKKLYQASLTARYGSEGSKAVFQFIKEQNPNLSPDLYLKVQQTIEGFRNEFSANQTRLVSQKQAYMEYLTATTGGRFYNMIGKYPRIDMDKYSIVTSDQTEQDFQTKRAEPLKIR